MSKVYTIVNMHDAATMLAPDIQVATFAIMQAGSGYWGVDDGNGERSPVHSDKWGEYFEEIGLTGKKLKDFSKEFIQKVVIALKSVEFGEPSERGTDVKGTSLTDVVGVCKQTAEDLNRYLEKYC